MIDSKASSQLIQLLIDRALHLTNDNDKVEIEVHKNPFLEIVLFIDNSIFSEIVSHVCTSEYTLEKKINMLVLGMRVQTYLFLGFVLFWTDQSKCC